MSDWIPIDERLPETKQYSYSSKLSKQVLVRGNGKYIYPWVSHIIADVHSDHWQWANTYNLDHEQAWSITHWMPLPELPVSV